MDVKRRDIEGLRAIAVLLVIFYHLKMPWISGGFIGVDVFFVISGFVITRSLMHANDAGRFSYSGFYARRIKRLVPAFLLVSFVTFLLISPTYMDDDYYFFSKTWLASLFGLSNLFYFRELSAYFSPDVEIISLLHTWSLAVEEQFYLLWPLLFVHFIAGKTIKLPLRAFVAIWVALLLLSITMAEIAPKAAYYFPFARFYELLIGAGLAAYWSVLPAPRARVAGLLLIVGSAMVIAPAFYLDKFDHFPGYNALVPVAGTALMIYAGNQARGLLPQLLACRPMVFTGALSYGLYLWHWPLVAYANHELIALTPGVQLSILALSFLLAWLSFRFVENRIRYFDWSFKKSFIRLVLVPGVAIWLVQVTIRTADDISFRIPEEQRQLYRIIQQNNAGDLYKPCFKGDATAFVQSAACTIGRSEGGSSGEWNAILLGDSHAIAQIGFVEQLAQDASLSMLVVTRASTPYLLESDSRELFEDPEKGNRNAALHAFLQQRPMRVVVGGYWTPYFSDDRFAPAMERALADLLQQGHGVFVLEDVPKLPAPSFAFCRIKGRTDCHVSRDEVATQLARFAEFKASMTQRHPDIVWIDIKDVQCDTALCYSVLDDTPLYRDESHLNNVGATLLGKHYVSRFANPLRDDATQP